jgi:hypothetical protein
MSAPLYAALAPRGAAFIAEAPPTTFDNGAELPIGVPTTSIIAIDGSTIDVDTDHSGNLQAAINAAAALDTDLSHAVEVTAGTTYTINGVTLPAKTGTGSNTGTIVIRSASHASLPVIDKRIAPAIDGTSMATFERTLGTGKGIAADDGAVGYQFRGIIFQQISSVSADGGGALVEWGDGGLLVNRPSRLSMIHCQLTGNGQSMRRGILLQADDSWVKDSELTDIGIAITEPNAGQSNGVASTSGGQRIVFDNVFFNSAGSQAILCGGGGMQADTADYRPSDWKITRCYFFMHMKHQDNSEPGWSTFTLANLFEIKNGRRFLIEGCIFDQMRKLDAGQSAQAVILKSSNQSTGQTAQGCTDITFRYNIFKRCGEAHRNGEWTHADAIQPNRFSFHDNFYHTFMNAYNVAGNLDTSNSTRRVWTMWRQGNNMVYQNETIEGDDGDGLKAMGWIVGTGGSTGFKMLDMVYCEGDGNPDAFGSDGVSDPDTAMARIQDQAADIDYIHSFQRAGGSQQMPMDVLNLNATRFANEAAVGFTDPANLDFSLDAGSSIKNDSSDGDDPGCDFTTLATKTANTESGDWS